MPKVTLALLPLITLLMVALIPVLVAMTFVAPSLKVKALLIVLLALNTNAPPLMVTLPVDKLVLLAPPEETAKVPPLIVVPPVKVFHPVRATVPVLRLSPKVTRPFVPLITPLKVALSPALAAILFVVLALKAIVLLIVLLALNNKAPPLRETVPLDKLVLPVPPEETDNVPLLIVVPPV